MRRLAAFSALALLCALPALCAEPPGLVVFLTDFGADSVAAGVVKGAVYGRFPAARVDSITHGVPAFDVRAGAWMLATGCDPFPSGTVFCCMVDPGTGDDTRAVVVKTSRGHLFVAPDNGLLTVVARRHGVDWAREASNRDLWGNADPAPTFLGRDLFAPLAASLALGVDPATVGPGIEDLHLLDLPLPEVADGKIRGRVLYPDEFGNLITDIGSDDLRRAGFRHGDTLALTIGANPWTVPLALRYGDVPEGERVALVNGDGLLELAVNMGSLAEATGAKPGDTLLVERP
jgi:S-adenosyl-L-methionine hydrolase (adenosine-forming)